MSMAIQKAWLQENIYQIRKKKKKKRKNNTRMYDDINISNIKENLFY